MRVHRLSLALWLQAANQLLPPRQRENPRKMTSLSSVSVHMWQSIRVCVCVLSCVCLVCVHECICALCFTGSMRSEHCNAHIQTDDDDDDDGAPPPHRKTPSAATAPATKTDSTVKKATSALKSESIRSSGAKEKDTASKSLKSVTISSKASEAESSKQAGNGPKLASHSSGQGEETASANRGKQLGSSSSSSDANKEKDVLAAVDAVTERAAAVMGWAKAVRYSLGCAMCVWVCVCACICGRTTRYALLVTLWAHDCL
jgi:hypothetical protein